ncbi:MAG TPA: 50S ribosomal protein L21 [Actinomycetota bacterium]|nr:50S ribosomal protein L21 [Actinomycetota bacterium]
MYAIIRAGGKQHKVAKGDVIEVEHVKDAKDTLEFTPLLVVDDKGKTRSAKSDLANAKVTAKVLGDAQGPKVEVAKYRNKTGYRRNTGHRQRYTSVQISDIKLTAGRSKATSKEEEGTTDGT